MIFMLVILAFINCSGIAVIGDDTVFFVARVGLLAT